MPKIKSIVKKEAREARQRRIRARILGTATCPRLVVFKSNTGVYLQIVDDQTGKTIAAQKDNKLTGKNKTERARAAGKKIAELALKKKITKIVFDRGGNKYLGRVAAVAEGARAGGLKF